MRRGYVDTPSGQLHYRTAGEGEAVIMLHQMGQSSREYDRVAPLLAADFHAIALDTPGYGFSDAPAGRKPEVTDYAAGVIGLLDGLGLPRAHLVGHHGGAVVAAEVAASHPDRVGNLVLIAFPDILDPEKAKEWIAGPALTYKAPDEEGAFLLDKWRLFKGRHLPGSRPEQWYQAFLATLIAEDRIYDGHHAVLRYDIASRLPLVSRPTLFVATSKAQLDAQGPNPIKMVPGCVTAVVESKSRIGPFENPEALAKVVLDFLKRA